MRSLMWIFGAVIIGLTAAACSSSSTHVKPTAFPDGLPPVAANNGIPDSMRPALDELAKVMESYGAELLIPSYMPEGLVLAQAGTTAEISRTEIQSSITHYEPPGKHSVLNYVVPDQHVYLNIYQIKPDGEEKEYLALDDTTSITPLVGRRSTIYPDGTSDVEFVKDAGFIVSFQDRGESIQIVADTHRCAVPGCFPTWCFDDDCPKFPEPVAMAIVNSLVPYAP